MQSDTGSFDMHRTLPLPPDRLWTVLTDPRHRESWGAPSEGTVLVMEAADVREGGQDRHRCGPAEAPEFVVNTRWYHLAAPDRAVFTETLVIEDMQIFTSLVTYRLEPAAGGTDLTVTVALSSFTGPDALDEVRSGWTGGLANLERHISTLTEEA